jgi:hypothetical protein
VAHSTCTFQTVAATRDERSAWFLSHDDAHPVTVAVSGDEVVGWGALSVYNPRQASHLAMAIAQRLPSGAPTMAIANPITAAHQRDGHQPARSRRQQPA